MKIISLVLALGVAGFYGCSDKQDAASGEDKTSLIEKAGQVGGELADEVKQGVSEAGQAATAGLGKATDEIGDAVDAVKQTGSQLVESVTNASGFLVGNDKSAEQSQLTVSDAAQAQTGKMNAELAAVADSGRAAINRTSADTAETRDFAAKTVATASLESAAVDAGSDPERMAIGKRIYSKHCMACHAAGVAGAPKVSDPAVWEPRVAQGMDTLYANAINGFRGSKGYMPPKGGFTTLNDDEVKAAVAYMVSVSR